MRYTGTHQPRRYLGGISALFLGFPLYIQSSQLVTVPAKHQATPTAAEINRDARARKPSQRQMPDPEPTESGRINGKGTNRLTPFRPVVVGEDPSSSAVRFPRGNGAQVGEESNQEGRSALWSATRPKGRDEADSIVDILLRKGANANCASETSVERQSYTERSSGSSILKNGDEADSIGSLRKGVDVNSVSATSMPDTKTTPLTSAVRAGPGMGVPGLLFSRDPPLHRDTLPKEGSATVVARFRENEHYMEVLKGPDRALSQTAPGADIVGPLNSLLARIADTVNYFTGSDVLAPPRLVGPPGGLGGSSGDLVGFPKQPEALAEQEFDPVRSDKGITGHVTSVGLSGSPADGERAQTVASEVTTFAKPGTTTLASPENLPGIGAYPLQPQTGPRLLGLADSSTGSGAFARSQKSKAFEARQPNSLRSGGETAGNITSVGLNKSPVGDEFLQEVARRGAIPAEPGTSSLASNEHSPELEALPQQSEGPAAQQSDPVTLYGEITEHIARVGLDKFFPASSEILQAMARKVGILPELGTATLASPEHSPGLAGLGGPSGVFPRATKSKALAGQQPNSLKSDKEVTGHINRVGPSKFPARGEFLHTEARTATTLGEPGTTALTSHEHFPGLGAGYSQSVEPAPQQSDPAKPDRGITEHTTWVGLSMSPVDIEPFQTETCKAAGLGTTTLAGSGDSAELGARPPQSEVLRLLKLTGSLSDSEDFPKSLKAEVHAGQRSDPVKPGKGITEHTTWVGLSMSPVDIEPLQTEACKAAESDTPALAGLENSPGPVAYSSQSEVLPLSGPAGGSSTSAVDVSGLPKKFDTVEFVKEITGRITSVGPRNPPADGEFLQTRVSKETTLVESATTALVGPGHSPGSGEHSPQSEAPAAKRLDPVGSDREIIGNITSVGPRMFPVDGGFLQTMASEGTALVESTTTALAGPGHPHGSGEHYLQSEVLCLSGPAGGLRGSSENLSRSPKSEVPAENQSDPVKLDKETTGHTTSVGLKKFLANNGFFQIVPRAGAKPGTAALASPEHHSGLGVRPSQPGALRLLRLAGNPNDSSGDTASAPKPEALAARQSDPVKFVKETAGHISSVALSKPPADNEYLQTVPGKAAESGTITLACPEHMPGLGVHPLQSDVPAAEKLGPAKSDREIIGNIISMGLSESPAGGKYLQVVLGKAAEKGTTPLASSEHTPGLGAHSSRPEVPAAKKIDPMKFGKEIIEHTTNVGLNELSADREYLGTLPRSAAELGATLLANHENLPGLGAESPESEVPAVQPLDPVGFGKGVTGQITSVGLRKPPTDGEYPQKVPGKAAGSWTTPLASSEHLPKLGADSSHSEPAAKQLDPMKFENEITGDISGVGLGKPSADGEYLQTVSGMATKSGTTTLASPVHSPGLGAHPSQPEAPAAKRLDPVKFGKELIGNIAGVGLSEIYAEGGNPQTVPQNAAEIATNPLASPENLPKSGAHSSRSEVPAALLNPVKFDKIIGDIPCVGLDESSADGECLQTALRKAAEPGATFLASSENFPGLGVHPSQSEAPSAQQLDPVEFGKEITENITKVGLSMPPGDGEHLQTVLGKAAEPGTTPLARPEHSPKSRAHYSNFDVPALKQSDPTKKITRNITGVGLSGPSTNGEYIQTAPNEESESGTTTFAGPKHMPGFGAHYSQSEAPAAKQLDPAGFDKEITRNTPSVGLGGIPADGEYPQTVPRKTAEFGTTPLASPEYLPWLGPRPSRSEVSAAQQLDPVKAGNETTESITSIGLGKLPGDGECLQTMLGKAPESGATPLARPEHFPELIAYLSQSETPAANLDPMEFEKEPTGHITSVGLSKLPAGGEFLGPMARRATTSVEPRATAFAIPDHLPGLGVRPSQSEVLRLLRLASASTDSSGGFYSPQKPETFAAQQLGPAKSDKGITRRATRVGLPKFPAGREFLQAVARKATIMTEPGTTALASPGRFPGLGVHRSQSEVPAAHQIYPLESGKEITENITRVGLSRVPAGSKFLQKVVRKAAESWNTPLASPEHSPRLGADPSQSEVTAAEQLDPVKFGDEITEHITSVGLGEFFPAESEFLQKVALKATTLAESEATVLAGPEYLSGLAKLSLYQHILFCDNSGSMNTSDRIESIIDVTKGITRIASYLLPDDEGLRIRFLNTTDTERELYDRYGKVRVETDAAEMVTQASYNGITLLGTILKEQVLEPYVYHYLNQGQNLERPLLISIITDGCPYGEDDDTLKRVIIECKQQLAEKNFNPAAVHFQINQIGNDPDAEAFLGDLRTDSEVKEHIFVSSDKLDEKYKELRGNKEELEIWLYQTLAGPLLLEG